MSFRSRFGALLVVSSLLTTQSGFAQSPELIAGARASAHNGLEAFEAGEFAKALDYFTRAESLVHSTPHLLYIARSRVKLGQLVAAQEAYMKIVRETLPADAQLVFKETFVDAEKELADLEPRIPRITVSVEGGDGTAVEVKSGEVVVPAALIGVEQPIDPGTYTFEARGNGWASGEEQVTVAVGGSSTVVLKLAPSETSAADSIPHQESSASWTSGRAIGGYAAIGVGVAGLVIGPVYLVQSGKTKAEADELYERSECPAESCDQVGVEELDDKSDTQKVIGIVGVSVGSAALITGVTLLILNANDKQQEASSGLRPWFAGDMVGFQGTF